MQSPILPEAFPLLQRGVLLDTAPLAQSAERVGIQAQTWPGRSLTLSSEAAAVQAASSAFGPMPLTGQTGDPEAQYTALGDALDELMRTQQRVLLSLPPEGESYLLEALLEVALGTLNKGDLLLLHTPLARRIDLPWLLRELRGIGAALYLCLSELDESRESLWLTLSQQADTLLIDAGLLRGLPKGHPFTQAHKLTRDKGAVYLSRARSDQGWAARAFGLYLSGEDRQRAGQKARAKAAQAREKRPQGEQAQNAAPATPKAGLLSKIKGALYTAPEPAQAPAAAAAPRSPLAAPLKDMQPTVMLAQALGGSSDPLPQMVQGWEGKVLWLTPQAGRYYRGDPGYPKLSGAVYSLGAYLKGDIDEYAAHLISDLTKHQRVYAELHPEAEANLSVFARAAEQFKGGGLLLIASQPRAHTDFSPLLAYLSDFPCTPLLAYPLAHESRSEVQRSLHLARRVMRQQDAGSWKVTRQ